MDNIGIIALSVAGMEDGYAPIQIVLMFLPEIEIPMTPTTEIPLIVTSTTVILTSTRVTCISEGGMIDADEMFGTTVIIKILVIAARSPQNLRLRILLLTVTVSMSLSTR